MFYLKIILVFGLIIINFYSLVKYYQIYYISHQYKQGCEEWKNQRVKYYHGYIGQDWERDGNPGEIPVEAIVPEDVVIFNGALLFPFTPPGNVLGLSELTLSC